MPKDSRRLKMLAVRLGKPAWAEVQAAVPDCRAILSECFLDEGTLYVPVESATFPEVPLRQPIPYWGGE